MQILRITKGFNADQHPFMTALGLITICAKQMIPPGEIEAKVAISLLRHNRMMGAMHIWCHYETAYYTINLSGNIYVAVIKH